MHACNNPDAYYFTASDPQGVALFLDMRRNPSEAILTRAADHTNATTAYFVIEQPRLGTQEYTRVKTAALANGLEIYHAFFHNNEEKLLIFH